MSETITPTRETLIEAAQAMVAASDGSLRLARNEADNSEKRDPEAATFLKLNGRRLGRDLEVYAFMASIRSGWGPVLPDIAAEVVLQLKSYDEAAFASGAASLLAMGRAVYPAGSQEAWSDIFHVDQGPSPA